MAFPFSRSPTAFAPEANASPITVLTLPSSSNVGSRSPSASWRTTTKSLAWGPNELIPVPPATTISPPVWTATARPTSVLVPTLVVRCPSVLKVSSGSPSAS